MTASERDSQKRGGRTSVVVRSGAPRDDKTDHQPTGPTGRTLVGVLAPTESEIGSAATRVTGASTSTTLPSLHSAGVQRALNPQDRAEDSGEQPKTSDESLEHYQVLECLAKGGSGVVYRVQDPSAGQSQSLALKVLRQGQHRDSSAVGAFAREAELMDALSHRNLVQFVHFGHENDEPFLLMEYIEGLSMADLLHHPVPLPLDVGLIIIQDALEALDYVHNVRLPEVPEGLVHCDVSPQNLLVGADGRTRLIDFGTSRAPGKAVGDANVRCKPRYSSPEVMGGEAVGPEGDIFSMGAVLFQLLSKQPAFSADPRRRKKESLVPNPSLLNRRAPTPFDPICQRALDPDPQGRFSSAREMLEVLDAAVETSGIELRRARVSFWVRRVIQSRHGDVEFDMSELEDLLESKRSHHQEVPSTPSNEPPSSDGGENTKDVKPEKGRSVPPPPVRTEQRESSDPPSGALGAASRYSAAPTSEGVPLSFRARMWITGMAVGAAVAVLLFALLKPDVFKGWFSVKETPEWERNTPYQPTLEEAQRREEELEQRLRERLEAEPPEQAPTEAPAADGPEISPVQGSSDSADSDEAPTTEPAGEASSNDAPAGGASKRQAESEGDTRSQASEKRAAKPRRAAVRQAPKPPQKPRAESQAPGTPTPTEPVTGAKPAPQVESGLPERPAEPQQATAQPTPEAPTAPTVPRTQQRPRGGLKPGVPVTP